MIPIDKFKGLGVALVTPFLQDGNIDFFALKNLVNNLISNNVDYLVILGTTAETPTLTSDEKQAIVQTVIEATAGRVPLLLGAGSRSTKDVLHQIEMFSNSGLDAVLSVTPYYNKPSQEGLYQHYREIANHSPLPIILYTVFSRTSCNLEAETTLRLAELDNIIGVKEASGNMNQIMRIIKHKPKDFLVISGDDAITLPLLSIGADGLISVVANAFPKEIAMMVHLGLNQHFDEARYYHNMLLDIVQACFKEGSPAGVKACLAAQQKILHSLRLPLTPVSEQLQQYMYSLMKQIK
jgi:4-hydroxy-tetrahydrodipicolinate synthase